VVLEGGAIDSNGRGTVLAAEQCLLHQNRNPNLSREQLERWMADYLGASKVLWLRAEIAGDDTDGHVDQFGRFVGPSTVVASVEENRGDANYASLRTNFDELRNMTDQNGSPLEVIALPMPRPVSHDGNRLPASYANFYVANGAVVVPQFDDPADPAAVDILSRQFPDREVMGLPAVDLLRGLGAFHCVTQQEPVG
jgi:agmatine deiminase